MPFRGVDIEPLASLLAPDNIASRAPKVLEGDGVLIGIFNPIGSLPTVGQSVCLGAFFGEHGDWSHPGGPIPDGNYALFRSDTSTAEVVTDVLASRTVWYVKTDEVFIASTSQRAIVYLLQSHEPNERAYPWMLSSGTLGPGHSWDARLQCVPGDSRLILDRSNWSLRVVTAPVQYAEEPCGPAEHESRLRQAIDDTCAQLDLDWKRWILPLSGGYDCRAILQRIHDRPGLKTITWGTQSALADDDSDAAVARELAAYYGLPHSYHVADLSAEPAEVLFTRFLVAGEGRVDHVSGYLDGFAIWKHIHESGCDGIVRGDEAFGCRAVRNDREVYRNMSMQLLTDYRNLDKLPANAGATSQTHPHFLQRRPGETREVWRDRTNTQFEFPFLFAALSDLKFPYVEVINPLTSRRILQQVRRMPDALRTGKSLFKQIVRAGDHGIRYAKNPAIKARDNVFREAAVADVIATELHQHADDAGMLGGLTRYALAAMESDRLSSAWLSRVANNRFSRKLRSVLGLQHDREILDPFCFAFRVYMIARMRSLLQQDAAARGNAGTRPCAAGIA